MLLIRSADIHHIPVPDGNQSSCSDIIEEFRSNLSCTLQCFLPKRDELCHCEVLAFLERWLNNLTHTGSLIYISFDSFSTPFSRDRHTDKYGGILVYINEDIPTKRRHDLQSNGIECIWVKLLLKNRKILFVQFIALQILVKAFCHLLIAQLVWRWTSESMTLL